MTIYAPMIYTALCIMFWMRAYPQCGEVGGGWALEFPSYLGPVKWKRAQPPTTSQVMDARIKNIMHRCAAGIHVA
jgi:hypothetical protein